MTALGHLDLLGDFVLSHKNGIFACFGSQSSVGIGLIRKRLNLASDWGQMHVDGSAYWRGYVLRSALLKNLGVRTSNWNLSLLENVLVL